MTKDDSFHVLVIGAGKSAKTPCILDRTNIVPGRVDASCRYHWPTHCPGLEEGRKTVVLVGCAAADMGL
jgi:hypothetical protein